MPETVNKSQAIRAALAAHPQATVGELVAILKKDDVKVSPGLVYLVVKSQMWKKKSRKPVNRTGRVVTIKPAADPVALIRKVKSVAAEVGGIKSLKSIVEAFSE